MQSTRLLNQHNQEILRMSPDPFPRSGWGLGTRLGTTQNILFAVYSANQSDYRKHVTSLISTPYTYAIGIAHHGHIILLCTRYTYMYTRPGAIHSQNRRQAVYPSRKNKSCLYAGTRCLRSFTNKLWQESASTGTLKGGSFRSSS